MYVHYAVFISHTFFFTHKKMPRANFSNTETKHARRRIHLEKFSVFVSPTTKGSNSLETLFRSDSCVIFKQFILYCIVSYRIVSYRIVLYRIVLYCIVLFCFVACFNSSVRFILFYLFTFFHTKSQCWMQMLHTMTQKRTHIKQPRFYY
jgi:hypothetical protein